MCKEGATLTSKVFRGRSETLFIKEGVSSVQETLVGNTELLPLLGRGSLWSKVCPLCPSQSHHIPPGQLGWGETSWTVWGLFLQFLG